MKNIAIIPARKGSKGLKNKNIIEVNHKPLIEYTIEAALDTLIFNQLIVSSNDENIKNICIKKYKEIQFQKRPEELCEDLSTPHEVVRYIIDQNNLDNEDIIHYLQPTSPLRNSSHILEANKLFTDFDKPVVSVTASKELPYKMFEIDDKKNLKPIFSEEMTNMRRQDLPKTYLANGAIYIFSVKQFNVNNKFPSLSGTPYIMKNAESYDIDTLEDKIAIESLIK